MITINCSYGEFFDKITILRIKKNKTTDTDKLKNINYELDNLEKNKSFIDLDKNLFEELMGINRKLWDLEDEIRRKGTKQEFDSDYIQISENIRKFNDERAKIKKRINLKFDSKIVEEKIYKNNE